jgi:type II secretory pathway component PulM
MDGIDKLREITARSRRIVFFGGAVLCEAGIPHL